MASYIALVGVCMHIGVGNVGLTAEDWFKECFFFGLTKKNYGLTIKNYGLGSENFGLERVFIGVATTLIGLLKK